MAGHEIRIIQFLSPTKKKYNLCQEQNRDKRKTELLQILQHYLQYRITSNFAALPAILVRNNTLQ